MIITRGHPASNISDPDENEKLFGEFYKYTVGQLHELLTRYGKLDLLWFDGIGWPGIDDLHVEETLAWIRKLQPGIVTNNRWNGRGGLRNARMEYAGMNAPEGWWENCIAWNGHWGYNPEGEFQPNSWVFETACPCSFVGRKFPAECRPPRLTGRCRTGIMNA